MPRVSALALLLAVAVLCPALALADDVDREFEDEDFLAAPPTTTDTPDAEAHLTGAIDHALAGEDYDERRGRLLRLREDADAQESEALGRAIAALDEAHAAGIENPRLLRGMLLHAMESADVPAEVGEPTEAPKADAEELDLELDDWRHTPQGQKLVRQAKIHFGLGGLFLGLGSANMSLVFLNLALGITGSSLALSVASSGAQLVLGAVNIGLGAEKMGRAKRGAAGHRAVRWELAFRFGPPSGPHPRGGAF